MNKRAGRKDDEIHTHQGQRSRDLWTLCLSTNAQADFQLSCLYDNRLLAPQPRLTYGFGH